MQFFVVSYVFAFLAAHSVVDAATLNLGSEVQLCKRNDPDISKCYCSNIQKLTPVLKDGIPEMNIQPIDPSVTEHVTITFLQSNNTRLIADFTDVSVAGLSSSSVDLCEAQITSDGIQNYLILHVPHIHLNSKCDLRFNVLLFDFNITSNIVANFSGVIITTTWNTTRYLKNNKEYLKFNNQVNDMQYADLVVNLDLFGINAESNDQVKQMLNANIDAFYNMIKPTLLNIINEVGMGEGNKFLNLFPYDVLFSPY